MEEVIRRAQEAWDLGAREICVQAGLPPKMDGDYYVDLTKAIKRALPDMHIHGFSPEEVLYGAVRVALLDRGVSAALKDAGVGSLPGTSAEILDQEVRDMHLARAHHEGSVDRGHHDGAPRRHPHDVDDHVRPRRDVAARARRTSACCATSRRRPAASRSSCR